MITLARKAMATRFEIVLPGGDEVRLRAAGEEALDEIERVEAQLSLFRPTSEISRVNSRAASEPVRVSSSVFYLLKTALRLSRETGGAFDITISPLMQCWGFRGGTGGAPRPEEIARARSRVGGDLVELDAANLGVRFKREGVVLDLGAIGKGYALDCAVEALREVGVTDALIHGGTSTVFALGRSSEGRPWKIGIAHQQDEQTRQPICRTQRTGTASPDGLIATVELENESLSVSAVWGRAIQAAGRTVGHVLDPRTGEPVSAAALAAVILPSATESDAFSTGLLVVGAAGHARISGLRPGMKTVLLPVDSSGQCLSPEMRGFQTGRAAVTGARD